MRKIYTAFEIGFYMFIAAVLNLYYVDKKKYWISAGVTYVLFFELSKIRTSTRTTLNIYILSIFIICVNF